MKSYKFFLLLLLLACTSCSRTPQREPICQRTTPQPIAVRKPYTYRPLIYLDPGHGGHDAGALSADEAFAEKNLALATTLMVRSHLQTLGYRVRLTRYDDTFVPLPERAAKANADEAKLFVSIHYNAAHNTSAKGIEVYTFRFKEKNEQAKESEDLAKNVLDQLIDHTGATSRGVKQANFSVLRNTKMPAILVEGGFMTNLEEMEQLSSPKRLNTIAYSIALGIHQHLSNH